MKKFLIACVCIFVGSSPLYASGSFPSEKELQTHLHRGMTIQQAISAFGEPGSQIGQQRRECRFRYLAPIGLLTAEREGYIGFEVQFDRERLVGWRTFRGNPSYEAMHAPRELKWIGKFYLILFGSLFVAGLVLKRLWGIAEGASLIRSLTSERSRPNKSQPNFAL